MAEHTIPYKEGWSWALTKIFDGHEGEMVPVAMVEEVALKNIESDGWNIREFAKGALAACKHYREIDHG